MKTQQQVQLLHDKIEAVLRGELGHIPVEMMTTLANNKEGLCWMLGHSDQLDVLERNIDEAFLAKGLKIQDSRN